LEISSKP
jgi:hypothetical protein